MIRSILYIFIGILFVSCYNGNNPPSGVMDPEAMKSIMWDMVRAQQMASDLARKDSLINAASETKALSRKIFEIHKIDSGYFNTSYDWYVRHPVAFKLIFDSLYAQQQRQMNHFDKKNQNGPTDYLIDPFKRRILK